LASTDLLERWRSQLAAWALPDAVISAAPESPWSHPVDLFRNLAEDALTPEAEGRLATVVAREALPAGGSVLDVGAGVGAASLPLAPPAGRIIGVDTSPEMMAEFSRLAASLPVEVATEVGPWPEVAARVPVADVVVCHNVLYNVADLGPFVMALAEHARVRTVVAITRTHPTSNMNAMWRHFWSLERPSGPTSADAAQAIESLGFNVSYQEYEIPGRHIHDRAAWIEMTRRRLCLSPDRDAEVAAFVPTDPEPAPRQMAVIWWDA
jgi:SAM-dependent methyltransferase